MNMAKNNIIKLFNDAPSQLRAIADQMEEHEDKGNECTVIWGGEVYQCMDERIDIGTAAMQAVFNCNLAVAKLMHPCVSDSEEETY